MGFPVVYPEMMLPKFLAHFLLLLGYLRRLLTWALDIFGLADLLLLDAHEIPSSSTLLVPRTHHRQPPHKPLFSVLIQAALPVTNYASSSSSSSSSFCMEERDDVCCYCAICLHEFSPGEEVRPLANCRHVFHRCCLDPWVELDQKTCPLCRTPLVPEWAKDEMDRKLRAQTPPVAAAAATTISTSSSYLYDDNGDLYDDPLGFFVQPFNFDDVDAVVVHEED